MSLTALRPPNGVWVNQAKIADSRAPPVQNTWYSILTIGRGRLIWLAAFQQNTETDNKNVSIEVTVDGIVYTNATVAFTNNTVYWIYLNDQGDLVLSTTAFHPMYYEPLEARNISIRYRLTSAAGTAQTLNMRIVYETM